LYPTVILQNKKGYKVSQLKCDKRTSQKQSILQNNVS